ncbi:acyl-CoA dehydrogenase [Sorangium cellulosum]|uniref:Acyl-CoA dehydrogenase n=1 Tax=Sorangium cellulosum TaxID=56 RepID=A0A2L0EHU6_SORCE|nr:acyl-CoA dehydrogenase family protein [Sorangium cellulosum]AUX38863.1 acyl-CoA dehydrogenase [Sorangium cellulosum]
MLSATEAKLIQDVRELARTRFVERASRYDRTGTFCAEDIAELQALRIPGIGLPDEFGGMNVSTEAMVRVVEEVAYGDASAAVAINMHFVAADLLLLAPTGPAVPVLKDIAENNALICGPGSASLTALDVRKSGYTARNEGDHIVVNGRGGFASMSEGAKYVFLRGFMEGSDFESPTLFFTTPTLDTPGISNARNWDAMGLRATSSHDIVCEDARIPKTNALVVPGAFMAELAERTSALDPVARQRRARGLLGILGIWLGLARAAVDESTRYIQARYGVGVGPNPLPGVRTAGYRSEEPWAQARLGAIAHQVRTSGIVLAEMIASADRPYESQEAFAAALGHTIYELRRMTEEVATDIIKLCGAHAYAASSPLERLHRDLMGCVAMAWRTDLLVQELGKAQLGMPFTVGGPVGI